MLTWRQKLRSISVVNVALEPGSRVRFHTPRSRDSFGTFFVSYDFGLVVVSLCILVYAKQLRYGGWEASAVPEYSKLKVDRIRLSELDRNVKAKSDLCLSPRQVMVGKYNIDQQYFGYGNRSGDTGS